MNAKAVLFLCLVVATAPSASAITLAWDPSPSARDISQYKLYERLSDRYIFVAGITSTQTRFNLPALSPGVHTFAVTAVSGSMESPPSNEVLVSAHVRDFANTATVAINGSKSNGGRAAPYPAEITVSRVKGVISNVSVLVHGLTHRVASHVDILLVGPQGQKVLLLSDVGGNNPVTDAELTFSDEAAQSLGAGPIISGIYKPSNRDPTGDKDNFPTPAPPKPYSGSLSVFRGTNPNGTWKLFVVEEGTPRGGAIASGWVVRIDTNGAPVVAASMPASVTSTTATLNGMINPMGQTSTFAFNYGLTTDYSGWQWPQPAGHGVTPIAAKLNLTGLLPNTLYRYRLVGQNVFGTSSSNEMVFLTPPLVDSDRDGIPDDYEQVNDLNPNSPGDATLDLDGDGNSNLQEYLAGTDPLDRHSAFRTLACQRPDDFSMSISTSLGKRYQLQRTEDLAASPWTVIQNQFVGTGEDMTIADPSAAGLARAFYRAVVLP